MVLTGVSLYLLTPKYFPFFFEETTKNTKQSHHYFSDIKLSLKQAERQQSLKIKFTAI